MPLQVEAVPDGVTHPRSVGLSHRRPAPGIRCLGSAASTGSASVLVGLVSFVVYCRTLAPSIVWGDSPELTTAAFCAGVPHPTGYPLYMILAHAFLRFYPFGSIAYRMNLLAALSGSAAVTLVYLLMRRITRARWISLVAALLFAFSRTFWSQAVIAEHYPFEMLCIAVVLSCGLAWDRRGERRWLFATALAYGLCLTHHMMSLLLAPGLLFFALTSRHRAQFLRELRWTLPLLLLPLSLYLYLPLAALRDPAANWGDPRTWDRFVAHVTGFEYHSVMFHLTRAQLWKHGRDYARYLPAQFSPAILWLALLGAWSLARRRQRLFGLTLLVYLADVIYALNYSVYNVAIYYLPSHLIVALWIASGLQHVGTWLRLGWRKLALAPVRRPALNRVFGIALLALPMSLLCANWGSNDRHDDWSALEYGRAALAILKPHAVLLGGGDSYYFPILYTHFVEKRRPDVIALGLAQTLSPSDVRLVTRLRPQGLVVHVPQAFQAGRPDGNLLLAQLVADNIRRRPTYLLCAPGDLQLPWLSAVVAPYHCLASTNLPCIELTRRPPAIGDTNPRPQHPKRVVFGSHQAGGHQSPDLELLGYDARSLYQENVPLLRMTYYWRVNSPAAARHARIWVLFTGATGDFLRKRDGSPLFHNTHTLAYGLGQGSVHLPHTLRETYTLFVPPEERKSRLHVQIAVRMDGQFLPTGAPRSPWAEIGELPLALLGEAPRQLASAAPPAGLVSRHRSCSGTHGARPPGIRPLPGMALRRSDNHRLARALQSTRPVFHNAFVN